MPFNDNNRQYVFVPQHGRNNIQTALSDKISLIPPRMPAYVHVRDNNMEYTSPRRPQFIPRKPLPDYVNLHGHTRIDSFDSLQKADSETSQESYFNEVEQSINVGVKRTWKFYGTFACLALLNFICAVVSTDVF